MLTARIRISLAVACIGLIVLVAWAAHAVFLIKDEPTFLRWRDPQVTARGETLYRAHCSSCHGMPDGSAVAGIGSDDAPAHDETGHTWQHPDYALHQLIMEGVAVANCLPVDPEKMPRFRGVLDDRDLVAVLSYIKSTWPDETRQHHDKVNAIYGPYNRAVGKLIEDDG